MQQCRRPRAFVRIKGLPVIELRIKLIFAGEAASLEPSTSMAGVDLGVNSRLALSDGTLVEGPHRISGSVTKIVARASGRCF